MTAPRGYELRPLIRAAAERRGLRVDDVYGTSVDFETKQVTLKHGTVRLEPVEGFGKLRRLVPTGESVFTLEPHDQTPPCATCGRS